jgi:nucleoside-diphosphate-sugar epimerase
VLGRRAIERLVAGGHDVTAIARSDEKAALLEKLGATPARVSIFDADALQTEITGHEVVANLATNIPPISRFAMPGAWKENDRIRTQGSTALTQAAERAGSARFIQESITFPYADGGDQWIDENWPQDAPANLASALTAEANAKAFKGDAVILRFAAFYGPDSDQTQLMLKMAGRGIGTVMGPKDAYQSSIHVDDAAAAVVAALAAAPGPYNVADDEPLTKAEFAQALADAVGKKKARRPPNGLTKLGGAKVQGLTRSHRIANAKLKQATGWAPKYASVKDGLLTLV